LIDGTASADSGTLTIYDSTFQSNDANRGGAVNADGNVFVWLYKSTFESNTAFNSMFNVFNSNGYIYEGGGAIYSNSAQVLLFQTTAVSNTVGNTPDHYSGSTFTHHCYDSFYYKVDTSNCDQCPTGRYKNFTLNPVAFSCKECPEGRYGNPAIAQASSVHCAKCPRTTD
jgi:hypothetical protein